jgi:hypothetical protein
MSGLSFKSLALAARTIFQACLDRLTRFEAVQLEGLSNYGVTALKHSSVLLHLLSWNDEEVATFMIRLVLESLGGTAHVIRVDAAERPHSFFQNATKQLQTAIDRLAATNAKVEVQALAANGSDANGLCVSLAIISARLQEEKASAGIQACAGLANGVLHENTEVVLFGQSYGAGRGPLGGACRIAAGLADVWPKVTHVADLETLNELWTTNQSMRIGAVLVDACRTWIDDDNKSRSEGMSLCCSNCVCGVMNDVCVSSWIEY